jgi:hypothetical protein
MSKNEYSTRSNRRRRAQPRGFVAGLTPEGQVNKVVADMNNLKDGYDLRNWSASARKELTPALTVKLLVGKVPATEVHVPKLALIVASPVVRAHFVKNPAEMQAKFIHADVSLDAVQQISEWLKEVCHKSEFPEIPVPEDLEAALKLRLTAHTLGMQRYVDHIEVRYLEGVTKRAPTLQEVAVVVDNTREKNDPIMVALANQLSYICRCHKVSQDTEISYANLLAEEKYGRLLDAVDEEKVEAMIKDD